MESSQFEEPVAVVRDHVLGRGGSQAASNLAQVLLRFELFFARGAPGVALFSVGFRGPSAAAWVPGGGALARSTFTRSRHVMFPVRCPEGAHAASVRG